jgi:hypothetical protein
MFIPKLNILIQMNASVCKLANLPTVAVDNGMYCFINHPNFIFAKLPFFLKPASIFVVHPSTDINHDRKKGKKAGITTSNFLFAEQNNKKIT